MSVSSRASSSRAILLISKAFTSADGPVYATGSWQNPEQPKVPWHQPASSPAPLYPKAKRPAHFTSISALQLSCPGLPQIKVPSFSSFLNSPSQIFPLSPLQNCCCTSNTCPGLREVYGVPGNFFDVT